MSKYRERRKAENFRQTHGLSLYYKLTKEESGSRNSWPIYEKTGSGKTEKIESKDSEPGQTESGQTKSEQTKSLKTGFKKIDLKSYFLTDILVGKREFEKIESLGKVLGSPDRAKKQVNEPLDEIGNEMGKVTVVRVSSVLFNSVPLDLGLSTLPQCDYLNFIVDNETF